MPGMTVSIFQSGLSPSAHWDGFGMCGDPSPRPGHIWFYSAHLERIHLVFCPFSFSTITTYTYKWRNLFPFGYLSLFSFFFFFVLFI